jgi:hypothetical protein
MDKVVHFEIPVDDMERAKGFYRSIFGRELSDWPMADGGVYVGARSVAVGDDGFTPKESGAINGGMVARSGNVPAPIVTMSVASIDEHLKKIEIGGGKIVKGKTEIAGMGYYAYVKDSEGNTIGLWEEIKKPNAV